MDSGQEFYKGPPDEVSENMIEHAINRAHHRAEVAQINAELLWYYVEKGWCPRIRAEKTIHHLMNGGYR